MSAGSTFSRAVQSVTSLLPVTFFSLPHLTESDFSVYVTDLLISISAISTLGQTAEFSHSTRIVLALLSVNKFCMDNLLDGTTHPFSPLMLPSSDFPRQAPLTMKQMFLVGTKVQNLHLEFAVFSQASSFK